MVQQNSQLHSAQEPPTSWSTCTVLQINGSQFAHAPNFS
jgi:hypothetical protein